MIKKIDWDIFKANIADAYTEEADAIVALIAKGAYRRPREVKFILLTRYVKELDNCIVRDDKSQAVAINPYFRNAVKTAVFNNGGYETIDDVTEEDIDVFISNHTSDPLPSNQELKYIVDYDEAAIETYISKINILLGTTFNIPVVYVSIYEFLSLLEPPVMPN